MIKMNINNMPFITGRWPLDQSLITIIFIHGAGNSGNIWKNQVDGLSRYMNTISIDLPGHGENCNNGMDSIESYAEYVEEFIKAVNPINPVVCGLSMGGAITLNLLINNTINFKAGIVINSGARLKVMPAIFDLIQNEYSAYTSSITVIGASASTDPSKLRDIIIDAENCTPEIVFKDFKACSSFDVTEKLDKIDIPVLVMTAEEDNLTPKKQGIFLADHLKNASHENINNAGHFSPVEKPEEVNEAILKFIEKIMV